MTALRIAVGVMGAVLLAVVIWAVGQTATLENFGYESLALLDQPWAVSALANLYIGYGLMAVVMMLAERSFMAGALWALPMAFVGNLWTVVWLALRLPTLAERLSRPDWPQQG
jgi:hypothetical protein